MGANRATSHCNNGCQAYVGSHNQHHTYRKY